MKKKWQKFLSVLLGCAMVAGLIPAAAADTVAADLKSVVLEPSEYILGSNGAGLVSTDNDKLTFYPVGSDGKAQAPVVYTGVEDLDWDWDSSYVEATVSGVKTVLDQETGSALWFETAGTKFLEFTGTNVVFEAVSEGVYGLYDLGAQTYYSMPKKLYRAADWYNYGEGKVPAKNADSGKYYYLDLLTGQNAFPGQEFDNAREFSEGYAMVKIDDAWKIINSAGQVTGELPGGYSDSYYTSTSTSNDGLFRLSDGYYDYTGAKLIDTEGYWSTKAFHNGYAYAETYTYGEVSRHVYGLLDRGTGDFIEIDMEILTDASPAGTVWAKNWPVRNEDGDLVYTDDAIHLINIADYKPASRVLTAVKYVPYSEPILNLWGPNYFSAAYGLPEGMALEGNILTGVPKEVGSYPFAVTVNDGLTPRNITFTLNVVESTDEAVAGTNDSGYYIETPLPETMTAAADQVFEVDDYTGSSESNYARFQDLYLDGEKLVGGKVSDPQFANADWNYCAQEGSTKITVFAQTFQNKVDGKHVLSATFRNAYGVANKLDTVSQTFTLQRGVTSVPTPAAATPVLDGSVAVGDVVNFTGTTHYYTSGTTEPTRTRPGEAKVTLLHAGLHPYHLIATPGSTSNVFGWVDAADIEGVVAAPAVQSTPAAQSSAIAKGAAVTVKAGAKTYTGGGLAWYVYSTTYTVIEVKGDRAVIGLGGVVTAAMNVADLIPA